MAVPMMAEEATKLGLLPSERLGYFKTTASKSNLAPASDQTPWYKLCNVTLPNPEPPIHLTGDHVQAVTRAQLPRSSPTLGADDLKIRRAILDTVAAGRALDGQRVPYSPNVTGAKNARALTDDAVRAAQAATASRQWQPDDLQAVVERAISGMKAAGWLVDEEIKVGRFRRGRGLRVEWSCTPWPDAVSDSAATGLQEGADEGGGQLVNGVVND